jgi:protein-tyrosine-phosphatase
MKIRGGFVSNSSSSSFVLYGASIDTSKVAEFLKAHGVEITDEEMDEEMDDRYDVADALDQYFIDNKINCSATGTGGSYDDTIQIGRSPWDINDDETGKQFRESVDAALKLIDPDITADQIDEVVES